MLAKICAAILTTLTVLATVAPAGAQEGPTPLDPVFEDVLDAIDGIDDVNNGAGSVDVSGARGTAWTGTSIARLTVGDDIDVRALDTLVMSTTDRERLRVPRNFGRGQAAPVSVYVRDQVDDGRGGPAVVPSVMYGESFEGENVQRYCVDPAPGACVGEQVVKFPEQALPLDAGVDWDEVSDIAKAVLTLAGAVRDEGMNAVLDAMHPFDPPGTYTYEGGKLVVPLPTGQQSLVVDTGDIVDGLLQPAAISTSMQTSGANARVESSIKTLEMLQGLSVLQEAGPGHQDAAVNGRGATAETKLAKIDQMTVLRTDALLELLGINSDMLPDETLAALADALGINTTRLLDTVRNAQKWGSVAELQRGIAALKDALDDFAGTGTCDLIDDLIRAKRGFDPWERAKEYGIPPPNCLGVTGALSHFTAAVSKLTEDLHAALLSALGDEAVVSLTKLNASVAAAASVTDDRVTQGGGVAGGIQRIRAAGAETELDVNADADTWNNGEAVLNAALNEFLGVLGPEFSDIIRVRLMPSLVQKGEIIDRRYVRSRAEVTLMKVFVDLPGRDAVEQALGNLLEGSPLGGLVGGGGGGGGGGGTLPLGRADFDDPITISIGQMSAVAEHTLPGRTLDPPPGCDDPTAACDSTLLTTSWDPETGWGPGGPGSSTDLPRTGGASGSLPIAAAAGMAASAVALRRFLARPTHVKH